MTFGFSHEKGIKLVTEDLIGVRDVSFLSLCVCVCGGGGGGGFNFLAE